MRRAIGIILLNLAVIGQANAVEPVTATQPETTENAKPAEAPRKLRYTKQKNLDFGKTTVQGNLRRPEASLVTAQERVLDDGILRLREDFLDKFAASNGEEIK